MVNFMDSKIGELVDALHTKAMWDDSILFFSADKCVRARPLYCRVGSDAYGARRSMVWGLVYAPRLRLSDVWLGLTRLI